MRQFGHDDFQRRHFIIDQKWKANWKTNKKLYDNFLSSESLVLAERKKSVIRVMS
jgi:hypothetical protein